MAVPDPSALPPPAAATPSPLFSLLIGISIFVVVIVVIVVIMAILQAVLPRTDSGADAVHAEEQEARRRRDAEAPDAGGDHGDAPAR